MIFSGTRDKPTKYPDTILVLGAQVKGTTKEDAYPSVVLKERLDTATTYIKDHSEATVIVCGGQGTDEPDSEANVMKNYLIKQGIPKEKIITEDTSTRTKENILNAQKKQPLNNTVIVTSDFHIYRAKLLAKRLDITEVSGLPAISNNSAIFKSYTREIIALAYGLLFDW
ncbi:Integral membrane protein [Vagococcus fluvialis bH819]|uniref:Integral membrane protein n=1 Tax=Vagococcus fluvialis bH819 TaxID=1255619 RepID=A0A1X6WMH9_9ENTE|nr:Integral membrane protein [Vagococcus fluvialis bH819]